MQRPDFPPPSVKPRDFFRNWLAMVGPVMGGLPPSVDIAAFEEAVLGLLGGDKARTPDADRLDLIAEAVVRAKSNPAPVMKIVKKLSVDPEFKSAVAGVDAAFRRRPEPADCALRALRLEMLRTFVAVLEGPALKLLKRTGWARDRADARATRALCFGHEGFSDAIDPEDPGDVAAGVEIASRVFVALAKRIGLGSLQAVVRLARGEFATASAAARSCGISPASVSNARARYHELASQELVDAADGVKRSFAAGIINLLRSIG